jgi:hypothetical protein
VVVEVLKNKKENMTPKNFPREATPHEYMLMNRGRAFVFLCNGIVRIPIPKRRSNKNYQQKKNITVEG